MQDQSSQRPSAPVAPGDVLAAKYRVEQVLGAGGMGVVVAATHLELQEKVAVKFLHPDAIQSPEAAARFLREARVAVKIRSENVARVIDVGRLDNGAPYMVMEYLEGEDLAARIKRGPIAVELAVDYLVQACAAMVEAHQAGVVHRDLKPANLFVIQRSDGTPLIKVLDFGISKLSVPDVSDAALTKTAALMGSPYYMSPEQLRSARDVDARSDIWSLGVIVFELLTGETPFTGQSMPELLANIMTSPPRSLTELRHDVPQGLVRVVQCCLEKEPEQRYQSVADLARALAAFAPRDAQLVVERISRVAPSHPSPSGSTAVMTGEQFAGTHSSWVDRAASETRSLGRPWLWMGVGITLLGALGVMWVMLRPTTPAPLEPSGGSSAAAAPEAAAIDRAAPRATAAERELVEPRAAPAPSTAKPEAASPPSVEVVPEPSDVSGSAATPKQALASSQRASAPEVTRKSPARPEKERPALSAQPTEPSGPQVATPVKRTAPRDSPEKNPLSIELK